MDAKRIHRSHREARPVQKEASATGLEVIGGALVVEFVPKSGVDMWKIFTICGGCTEN